MNQEEERVLEFKKIIFSIMKTWKGLLLLALLGAVVLGAVKYYSDCQAIQQVTLEQEEKETITQDIEELWDDLTEDERQNISLTVEYYEQFMDTREYMDTSVLMNMDTTHVDATTLQLMIGIPESVTEEITRREYIYSVMNTYSRYVNSGMLISDIYDDLNTDISGQYIQELIAASFSEAEDNVCMYVRAYNVDELEGLSDYIAEALCEYSSEVTDTITEHTLTITNTYNGVATSYDLYNRQQAMWNSVANYQAKWTNAKKALTEDALKYYEYLTGDEQDSQDDETVEVTTGQKPGINFKYVILGAFLGAFGWCCLIVLKYMLSGYMVTEADYTSMFGLKYFGIVFEKTDKKISFLEKLEYGDERTEDITERISFIALKVMLACRGQDITSVALVSSDFANIPDDICNEFVARMEKERINVTKLENVLTDRKGMCDLFEIGYCVLMEGVGVSKVSGVRKVMELCKENNINVLGVVDVKK